MSLDLCCTYYDSVFRKTMHDIKFILNELYYQYFFIYTLLNLHMVRYTQWF